MSSSIKPGARRQSRRPQATGQGPSWSTPDARPRAEASESGARRAAHVPLHAPGSRIGHGRYVIGSLLGRGGMAEVYAAEHAVLRSPVAIKVLSPALAPSPELRERFVREGLAAAAIRHPHIVSVLDAGNDDEGCYLVMERLEGETLRAFTARRGALPIQRAVDILLPVLAALAAAHRAAIVHRDIKPENVFVTRDAQGRPFPKLLDFGISKLGTPGLSSITQASAILGTPRYMSPEQAQGESVIDAATDQFSAAMVLFECVAGRVPYAETKPLRLLYEVAGGVELDEIRSEPRLKDLSVPLERALATSPSSRFPTIDAFGAALAPFASPRIRGEWAPVFAGRAPARSLLPAPPDEDATTGRHVRRGAETCATLGHDEAPRSRKPTR